MISENNNSGKSIKGTKDINELINFLESSILFKNSNKDTLKHIAEASEIIKYKIGFGLTDKNIIQSRILIILQGEARLIGYSNNEKTTVTKLRQGEIIGLSSLLRCSPCEEISASTEIIALSIPDKKIVELYQNDQAFRKICDNTLFKSEILGLINELIKFSPTRNIDIQSAFKDLIDSSEILKDTNNLKDISQNKILFVASNNIKGKQIGEEIDRNFNIENTSIINIRIISLEKKIYEKIFKLDTSINYENKNINRDDNKFEYNEIQQEDTYIMPEESSLDFQKYKEKKKTKIIKAEGAVQEVVATIEMLTIDLESSFRKDTVEKFIRDEFRAGKKVSNEMFASILSMHDLYVGLSKVPARFGSRIPTPSLISYKNNILLVKNSNSEEIQIACPKEGLISIKTDKLEEEFPKGIDVLIVQKTNTTPGKKFNIGWFVPSLKKYKSSLLLVLFSSFIVQLFGLANPLLIQVIIDKVISQRSLETLQILGIALVFVTLLGGILGGLRTFLFTETTNKIDTRLGAEIIDHLLRLPLNYFDKRPVGELGSRVGELERIREFLTGQALTTILDAAFSIIYIVVMFIYSNLLTFIALGVIPIQILLTLLGAPLIRRQIREVANQNAKTQSHLVEVLTGVQTVKAQNIETITRWKWQDLYGGYISRTFEKTITYTSLNQISQVLQQLSQLLVLWVGASLVLNGYLTLGQLIAFRIISGYVTQPLLRLSSIWQSVQELKVSFERLADIVDTPKESTEKDKTNIQLPQIKGKVEFKDVSFQFKPSSPFILKNINLSIESGQFVGIVGQSGSGKSTLMKVLPRLYELNGGQIIIDDFDVSKTELYSLRRQIGIVPQDPLLFSGTVSENIAITNPEINSEEIIKAAKIANAHDFIMTLPDGYSTNVGERGASLSGGQKQRIAIARTILNRPNLLVLDEATSALDYQTERKVCENLREACKGSTVFFITHRLNTIKNADLIVLMNEGFINEKGTHEELMDLKGRYYALYQQQDAV